VATLQLQTSLKIILSLLAAPLPGEPSDVDICKVHFGLILAEGLSVFKDLKINLTLEVASLCIVEQCKHFRNKQLCGHCDPVCNAFATACHSWIISKNRVDREQIN